MKSTITALFAALLSLSLLPAAALAAQKVLPHSKPDLSMKLELEGAIGKGLGWLSRNQSPDGSWGEPEYPALTALALTAFQGDPSGIYRQKYAGQVDKGYDWLLGKVKPDGGIYAEKLANYNTSIAMMALLVANNPTYEPILKKARQFVIGSQTLGSDADPVNGGIGYGGRARHSDMSTTAYALEALHYTRYLKSDVANDPEAKDLNWKAVAQFISRSQNLPGPNDQPWASDDPANKGGFVYYPGKSMAGEQTLANGKVALRSYGSMTYAGLMSMIHAQMDRQDPRVKAALDWATRNYTLEENPGVGPEGLFYYYHVMAKALSAAGVDVLTLQNGRKVNWRQDLAKRLLNLQREDGSWANTWGRWMEKDPVLVTGYATLTLEMIHRGL